MISQRQGGEKGRVSLTRISSCSVSTAFLRLLLGPSSPIKVSIPFLNIASARRYSRSVMYTLLTSSKHGKTLKPIPFSGATRLKSRLVNAPASSLSSLGSYMARKTNRHRRIWCASSVKITSSGRHHAVQHAGIDLAVRARNEGEGSGPSPLSLSRASRP